MDQAKLLALGQYLNENLSRETCNNTMTNTIDWLENEGSLDVAAELAWLAEQGADCDCEVVLKLYLPAREKETT